jgi:hypothetical protein
MPTKMQIARLAPFSLAKVLSIYYVFWGFVYCLVYLLTDKDAWYAPLGFWTLFLAAKINITFHTGESLLAKVGFLFWSMVCFAITGWLTGFISAAIYNLCSRTFGLQVLGEAEPNTK